MRFDADGVAKLRLISHAAKWRVATRTESPPDLNMVMIAGMLPEVRFLMVQ